jgi:hypothetical protein
MRKMMINSELSPIYSFGNLPLSRYRIGVRLSQPLPQTTYMGSAWRGVIGWELQRLICPFTRRPECKSCLIRDHCPYFQLFEDQSPFPGIQEMPRGYIFSSTEGRDMHEQMLIITLIGSCIRYFPAILKAVHEGGSAGIGPSRIGYAVQSVSGMAPGNGDQALPLDPDAWAGIDIAFPLVDWISPCPAVDRSADFVLATPVRLRKQGKYLGKMDWPYFFATIVRRLEALNCLFANGEPLGKERYLALAQAFADTVTIQSDLSWVDYSRYSNRQHKKVPMGGLVGAATLKASESWVFPWLQAAGLVHVGKGASMGLGKIILSETKAPIK